MDYKFLSRRRFLEDSISGGLAVGLEICAKPLGAISATIPGTDGLSLKANYL